MVGLLLRIISFFINLLPEAVCRQMAKGVAVFLYSVIKVRREVVLRNLSDCFGTQYSPEKLEKIARGCYVHFAMMMMEFIRMPKQNWDDLQKIMVASNPEVFKKVMSEGKGLIFVSGHLGNWEISLAALSYQGYKCYAYARPIHDKSVDRWINDIRHAHDIQMIHSKYSLRPVFTALQENGVVGFLIDQDAGRHGIFVNFFGRPASTFEGPAYCAIKCNTPILPAYIVRDGSNKYHVFLQDPLYPNPFKPEEEEIARLTNEMTRSLESFIRLYPEQYFWFHNRWKHKPKV